MTRYAESRWYRRIQIIFTSVTVVGGTIMLLGAAIAQDGASIALLVIGGAWLAMGLAGATQRRHVFRSAEFDSDVLTLVSPSDKLRLPANEILEIRCSRGDINRFSALHIHTETRGTIRLSPRLNGLIELLVELRTANPGLNIRGF